MDSQVESEFKQLVKDRKDSLSKATGAKNINLGYLLAILLTVALGTVQFGYSIGSWNATFDTY